MVSRATDRKLRIRLVLPLIGLLLLLGSCESLNPWNRRTSAWHDCMQDAGYLVMEWSSAPGQGSRIISVEIIRPEPTDEMLAQSERCVLEVNGGVRVTSPTTTLPPGLAGVFTACMAEAGFEVHDVEILVPDGGFGSDGSEMSFGVMGPPAPDEVLRHCQGMLETGDP